MISMNLLAFHFTFYIEHKPTYISMISDDFSSNSKTIIG